MQSEEFSCGRCALRIACWSLATWFAVTAELNRPALATNFFWNNSTGGPFTASLNWSPIFPLGPGGAGDTVNFNRGVTPANRYNVTNVTGQNDQLFVRNDSLTLRIANYNLLNTGIGLRIGVTSGDVANVRLVGNDGNSLLQTGTTILADVQGSTGLLRVDNLRWINNDDLRVGSRGEGHLSIENGATVSTRAVTIGSGQSTNPVSTVTVRGAETTWTVNTSLQIGDSAPATLIIEDGSRVVTTNFDLASQIGGFASGATGFVSIAGQGSDWTNSGRIGISPFGTFIIQFGATVSSSGTLSTTGVEIPGAEINGFVQVANGASWTNNRLLRISSGTLSVESGGLVTTTESSIGQLSSEGLATISGGGAALINTATLTVGDVGRGRLFVTNGGLVSNTDAFVGRMSPNGNGEATINGDGAVWTIDGRLSIGGDASGSGTNGGTGTVNVGPGGKVQVAQDTVLFPDGVLRLEGGTLHTSTFDFRGGMFNWAAGTLHVGTYPANLINSGGTLAPGASAGHTLILGNYTQQAAATLEIEIGGTTPITRHDVVELTGTAVLGGELQLRPLDGFLPSPSDTLTVFGALGGIAGVFSNVTSGQRLTTTDGIGSFLVHYGLASPFNQNQIVLNDFQAIGLPGDYNNDGTVDAADFVAWRKNPDAFGGDDDYNTWRANFGRSAGSGTALPSAQPLSSAVPEPAALSLLLFAAGLCYLARWSRGRAFLKVSRLPFSVRLSSRPKSGLLLSRRVAKNRC